MKVNRFKVMVYSHIGYFEQMEIEKAINDDIDTLKEFECVENYIDTNFKQFLHNGEYEDNSLDLAYNYKMLKAIEADKEFIRKLNFVLSEYVNTKLYQKKTNKN